MPTSQTTTYASPFGAIRLRADDAALLELTFADGPADGDAGGGHPVLAAACAQLDEYFDGTRTAFDLPLRLGGTAWEQRVWAALQEIPYGETTTYGALAVRLGAPGAARAVGAANGRNPVSIVVPCHRVVGAGGALTGYAWGVARKSGLLDLERGALPLLAG
jgi:methylated-DNA-[protein]-cysteine S-methyltransferase